MIGRDFTEVPPSLSPSELLRILPALAERSVLAAYHAARTVREAQHCTILIEGRTFDRVTISSEMMTQALGRSPYQTERPAFYVQIERPETHENWKENATYWMRQAQSIDQERCSLEAANKVPRDRLVAGNDLAPEGDV